MYLVKEIFYSLQGEGAQVGRATIFIRLAGCNLWTGREIDRRAAICRFCDTDFLGTDGPEGGKYSAVGLARKAASLWPVRTQGRTPAYAVLTGGEPALQVKRDLIVALHNQGFEVGIETNGSMELPTGFDWITVSPKAGTDLKVTRGCELKLVFPQHGAEPCLYDDLCFRHFFLQPMDGPFRERHTQSALRYCLSNPRWRLSLQIQKILVIP